jgi:hypothetical protein
VCTSRTNNKIAVVNFHLPFVLSGSNAVLILAAIAGILGLFLFFRGFFRLQHHTTTTSVTPKLASSATASAALVATRLSQLPATSAKTEVIRLTSDETPTTVSMSQQGKIAAALLKAGIPSPASWNTDPETTVDVAASTTKTPSALQTSKLKLTPSPPSPTVASPKNEPNKNAPSKSDPKKPVLPKRTQKNYAWMLWAGVTLFVLSVYLVAAHFGWL